MRLLSSQRLRAAACGRRLAGALAWNVAAAAFAVVPVPVTVRAADTLDARLSPCLACHGTTGASRTPGVPSLGGQPAYFLTIQLYMFREKLRVVEPMNRMLQGLGNDALRQMADSLSRLPPPPIVDGAADRDRMERARTLAEQHRCHFCHGADYAGADNVPRLAGQREDYLAKTLRDYKSNTRRGYDASMADVLHPVSDEEILDLAYFLARVR